MSALVVLVVLLVLVALGAWLIWRPRGLAVPARLRDDPASYDLSLLLPPYRERFAALQGRGAAADTPERHTLLRRAYALASEGSALTARMQAGARTAELPVQEISALHEQFHEMRERRDQVNTELSLLEAQAGP